MNDASETDQGIDEGIAEHVRNQILGGHLPPGTKLGEAALAEIFGINRSRVRRILQMLSYSRLVELRPNRGAYIASPGVKEAHDVFAARRVIESVTTEIAARTILTPHLLKLRGIVERETRSGPGDYRLRIALAGDFHVSLAQMAHNIALIEALEPLILRSALILAAYSRSPYDFAVDHTAILDRIEAGRSAEAGKAMERCLFAAKSALIFRDPVPRPTNLEKVLSRLG